MTGLLGGGTVRMTLVVDDPDAAPARAIALGHHWEIGRPLAPCPPDGGDR